MDAKDKKSEVFNRVRKYKEQPERNTITEMKNKLEEINSRLNDTEEWISELEDRIVEIKEAEQKKRIKNKKI